MTPGIALVMILAVAAVAFIVAPLLRSDSERAEVVAAEASEERELQSRQEMLLSSLKDLEDDHSTEKIGQTDYEELKTRLSGQAMDVMRKLDSLEVARDARDEPGPRPVPSGDTDSAPKT